MMDAAELLDVTGMLYDAAAGSVGWPAPLDRLKRLVGARTLSLMVGDLGSGEVEVLASADIPADGVLAYRQHFRTVDLWTTRAIALTHRLPDGGRPRVLVGGEMLVPDREYVESEFYRDFGRHHGLRHVVGTAASLGAAGVMPIGLHRREGDPPFGAAERAKLAMVLPHLRRAMQLRHRLRGAALAGARDGGLQGAGSTGLSALDALPMGVLVVDDELRVVLANRAAEAVAQGRHGVRLLRSGPLGTVQPSGTRLVVAGRKEAERLLLLVHDVCAGGAGGALRLRSDDATPGPAVLVTKLPRRLGGERAGIAPGRALVLLRELGDSTPVPPSFLLRDLFGLTRSEAEIARALSGGATKAAVAAGRGSRETTVRSQIRAILDKTGTANLRDLERLLATLPVTAERR